jgi:hypothetical protein
MAMVRVALMPADGGTADRHNVHFAYPRKHCGFAGNRACGFAMRGFFVTRVVSFCIVLLFVIGSLFSTFDRPTGIPDIAAGPISAAAEVSVTDAEQTAQAETETAASTTETNTPGPTATNTAESTASETSTEVASDTPTNTATATETPTSTSTATNTATATATPIPVPAMSLSASSGNVGTRLSVQVRKFRPNSRVAVYWDSTRVLTLETNELGTARGSFSVPASVAGYHTVKANGALSKTASKQYRVLPLLKLNTGSVTAGRSITATVSGFGANATVKIRLYDINGSTSYVTIGSLVTNGTGSGQGIFTVPRSSKAGYHKVLAVQSTNRDDTTLNVKVPTATPTKTATPKPTSTSTPRPTATPAPIVRVVVSVNCYSNPELTTISNGGNVSVTIYSVGSIYLPRSAEPYVVNRTLSPGQKVTYQTGSAATGSNALTPLYIYADAAGADEGARVKTNKGTFDRRCSA